MPLQIGLCSGTDPARPDTGLTAIQSASPVHRSKCGVELVDEAWSKDQIEKWSNKPAAVHGEDNASIF